MRYIASLARASVDTSRTLLNIVVVHCLLTFDTYSAKWGTKKHDHLTMGCYLNLLMIVVVAMGGGSSRLMVSLNSFNCIHNNYRPT